MESSSSKTLMSWSLNESEKMSVLKMFPSMEIDFKDWKLQHEEYVQTSKQTVDTARDSRCDFYIPNSGTFIKSFYATGVLSLITTAGVPIVPNADDAANLILWVYPRSTAALLRDFSILNNNSAGEILFEIQNNAGHVLDLKLQQGPCEWPEYLYYWKDDALMIGTGGDTLVYGPEMTCFSAAAKIAETIPWVQSQLIAENIERNYPLQQLAQYIAADAAVDQASGNTGRCVMIDSTILDTKWDIFPICLC